MVPFILGENAWDDFPNLKRLFDQISARLAAQTAAALKERHSFKPEMDDEVATICSDIWLPRPADISRVPPSLRSASKTAARQR
jgi:GST-like protein